MEVIMGKIIHNGVQITREINTKNIVGASTSTSQATSSTNGEKVPMTTATIVGTKLTKTDDGGIKIGSGVSYVKACGAIIFSTISGVDERHHILIYKNGTNHGSLVYRLRGNWEAINIQPTLIPVSADDVIYLYVRTQDSSGATVYSATLTVEVVQ
jgi:hypothetical protein